MKLVLILMALALNQPKEEKKVIFKTIPIDSPKETLLIIDNLNGDVSVEPSSDGLVHVYLEILMEANNEQLLSKARKELELGQYVANDSIVLFTKAPFIKKCHWGNGWGYDIRNHPKYAFKYQYKVKVPREMSLEAKTVNNGDVVVQDMDGPVKVCNVNGAVVLVNQNNRMGPTELIGIVLVMVQRQQLAQQFQRVTPIILRRLGAIEKTLPYPPVLVTKAVDGELGGLRVPVNFLADERAQLTVGSVPRGQLGALEG